MFQTFMKDQYQWDEQFDKEPQYSQCDMEKAFNAGRASSEFDRQFAINTAGQLQKALVNLMAEHAEIQKCNTDDEKDKWLFRQYAGNTLQGLWGNADMTGILESFRNNHDPIKEDEAMDYLSNIATKQATALVKAVKEIRHL